MGIPVGSFVPTGISFNRKFFGVKLYDIIMTAYSIAHTQTKKKYILRASKGKISVEEKGKIKLGIVYQNGSNIMDSSFSEDINSMINKVVVIDKDGKTLSTMQNQNDIKNYGQFQKILKSEEGKDATLEAKAQLNGITQKTTLKGIGDTSCITGYALTVKDDYTGVVGLFYIESDKHTWQNGVYTIDLNLNFENIMTEVNSGEEEKKEEDKK